MNNLAKVAIAMAAVVVVAIAGLNLVPTRQASGGLGPSAHRRADGLPQAKRIAEPLGVHAAGTLAAGTYEAVSEFDLVPFSFTVPDGWNSEGGISRPARLRTRRPDPYVNFVPVGQPLRRPLSGETGRSGHRTDGRRPGRGRRGPPGDPAQPDAWT